MLSVEIWESENEQTLEWPSLMQVTCRIKLTESSWKHMKWNTYFFTSSGWKRSKSWLRCNFNFEIKDWRNKIYYSTVLKSIWPDKIITFLVWVFSFGISSWICKWSWYCTQRLEKSTIQTASIQWQSEHPPLRSIVYYVLNPSTPYTEENQEFYKIIIYYCIYFYLVFKT